jgi:CelD/BcsL family acetyltransferase involved in cellulose biosynthesis
MIEVRQVEFDDIRSQWSELEKAGEVPTIFQTIGWVETWWKNLQGERRQILLAAFDGNFLVGIAPLYTEKMSIKGLPLLTILRPMGGRESDYHSFILKTSLASEVLSAFMDHLKRMEWDVGWLINIRQDTVLGSQAPTILKKAGYLASTKQGIACPYISLKTTFESYRQGLAKSIRHNINNYSNKLGRVGKVIFIKGGAGDMGDFFKLHDMRWREQGQSGALNSDELMTFHRQAARLLAPYLNLSFLELDGRRIACQYGYDFNGIRYFYLPGMDPAFRDYRLGTIMIIEQIKDAIKQGLMEFDFMRGEESYKYHFTGTQRRNIEVFFSKDRLKWSLFCLAEKIKGPGSGWHL